VVFPNVLDIAPFMSKESDEPPCYELYGVVVHVDMFNASFFGHYKCYVKDFQGVWYKINDSMVNKKASGIQNL
jgi:ubiquitin carboxyl-terminal hydrolase 36/42